MEKKNYFNRSLKLAIAGFWVVATTFTITSCEKETLEGVTLPSSSSIDEVQGVKENGAAIPGKYIVVFKDDADFGLNSSDTYEIRQAKMRAASQALLRGKGIAADKIGHVYGAAIKGMAVGLTNAEFQKLRQDPRVAYIEQDRVIKLAPPDGKGPKNKEDGGSTGQEIPWGVTRVGGAASGSGKTAWVVDTGIDLDHPDLNVDAGRSITVFTSGPDSGSADDLNGHGSHVAGTIGAIDNKIGVVGVAAGASVIAVKVLDRRGSGTYSGVIAGVNYVAEKASDGDVANMSLGGSKSDALNDAVIGASYQEQDGVSKNIYFAIAAGNDGKDASSYSPASAEGPNIFTVSAMNTSSVFASWSNYGDKNNDGKPLDFCAPGVSIESTWKDGGYNTISGTSMAAPHVAGILLLLNGKSGSDGTVSSDKDGFPDPIAHRSLNVSQ